jgi:hypothetical protein
MTILITPELNVPPPFRMTGDEIMSLHERTARAFSTVQFLQDNGLDDEDAAPTEVDRKEARALFMDSPTAEPEIRTPGKALMLRAMLTEYDIDVVRNAGQVRRYIQLKLLEMTDSKKENIQLKALEMLGKMTDVGAFTERLEINVTHRSTEELENELASKLAVYMGDIIDVESKEFDDFANHDPIPQAPAVQMIDLDEELGFSGGEMEDGEEEEVGEFDKETGRFNEPA